MKVTFDNADGYTELYIFNQDNGYNTGSLTGQFTYQYLYKTSNTCPCETNALQYGMPALFIDATPLAATSPYTNIKYWTNSIPANTDLKRADATTKYFINPNFIIPINGYDSPYYLANEFWVDANNVPAGMTILDFQKRTFTFTTVTTATCGTLPVKPPTTGCKCAKLLDLVISLDRSGSISVSQWKTEHSFTKNLTQAFEYGVDKANAGVVNWNAATWDTLPITSGNTDTKVSSTINSMTCCGTPPATTGSCCCCGTPIGGGLWKAGNMMLTSTRTKATKVIVLLTDGCQNHIWDPLGNPQAKSCGCSSELACQNNTACRNDITKWYNWVRDNIPGVKVIVIGVGTSANICPSQLLLAAGNDPTKVFQPQSWADLLTIVQSISATACTTDNVLCPGCCGICTCGVCYAPVNCFDQDACNKGVVLPGSGGISCCGVEPVVCTPPPCKFALCDRKLGCVYNDLKCKANTTCLEYYCDDTSVVCASRPITPVPQPCKNITLVQCVDASDCNDRTNCTTDTCVNGKCVYTDISCPASTKCEYTTCKPTIGCYTQTLPCPGGDACNIVSCDPTLGCVTKQVTCAAPSDPCLISFCDPKAGCQTGPASCANLTAENCTVAACNQSCYLKYVCYNAPPTGEENAPPTEIIITATLTTAAIAGIVIGGVLLVAALGGGAVVAVAGGAGAGGVTAVFSNPVYAGTATEGNNPLNQG
jgi:hypothetical protein